MATENFDIWLDDAPVLILAAIGDFSIWLDDCPVIELGGANGTEEPSRRRMFETIYIK